MDLGIEGRRALVCGSSKGLGRACAVSLAQNGVLVTLVARGAAALAEASDEIRGATGVDVRTAQADITTATGRTEALRACPAPDIVITNAGGPPPGDFREWERDHWIRALDANMLAPIELIKATVDGMIERRFGRIVNITSSAVKAPIDGLGLSSGARLGLTGFIAGLARSVARHNVTINNLLPGAFETDRFRSFTAETARRSGRTVEQVLEARRSTIPAGRIGDPGEFGEICAFLCSAQAGYITGQNLVIDGGSYPGVF
jgi:3-oxoacyl-[acyl-carrier protein] reductase